MFEDFERDRLWFEEEESDEESNEEEDVYFGDDFDDFYSDSEEEETEEEYVLRMEREILYEYARKREIRRCSKFPTPKTGECLNNYCAGQDYCTYHHKQNNTGLPPRCRFYGKCTYGHFCHFNHLPEKYEIDELREEYRKDLLFTLCSPRAINRIGRLSNFRFLSTDLMRILADFIGKNGRMILVIPPRV